MDVDVGHLAGGAWGAGGGGRVREERQDSERSVSSLIHARVDKPRISLKRCS